MGCVKSSVLFENSDTSKTVVIKDAILQASYAYSFDSGKSNHSISLLTLDNMMKDKYIEQTSGLRNGVKQLIISYIKPHKPVVSTTISRWIKFVLKGSGIDIDTYSSHSTRSAASSKAKESSWLVQIQRLPDSMTSPWREKVVAPSRMLFYSKQ
ncbi:hypothetical protein MAR_014191, partial [Mya arenaria]